MWIKATIWVAAVLVAGTVWADEIVQARHRCEAPLVRFVESDRVWMLDANPPPPTRLAPPVPRPKLALRVSEEPRRAPARREEPVTQNAGAPTPYREDAWAVTALRGTVPGDRAPVQVVPASRGRGQRKSADAARVPLPDSGVAEPGGETGSGCRVTRVYFQQGSAWVSPAQRRELLARVASWAGEETPLAVSGFTCDLGEQDLNDRLALERAREVGTILKESGRQVALVEGHGKADYATEDPAHREANRRVEVRALDGR